MLHFSKIGPVLQGMESFSFKAVASYSGELISAEGCTCSSYYVDTVNIRFPSGEIRKLKKILFLEINGHKIFV